MGRWDEQTRNCQKCGKIHDCQFYAELEKSLNNQLERYEIMVNWYAKTLQKIEEEIDKGFPSEMSDK